MNIKRNILKHGTKKILVENCEALKNYAQENKNVIANNINNLQRLGNTNLRPRQERSY